MEAFMGVWKVDPSQNEGIGELFDHVAPPGFTKEELMRPHSVEYSQDGDTLNMKTLIPGKADHVIRYCLGEPKVVEGPGGMKIEMSGRFEDGKIYSCSKMPNLEIEMVRYLVDGDMVSDITVNGKTWTVKLTR